MKIDIELLEMAALAAQDSNIRKAGDVFIVAGIGGCVTYWNPLTDDGDALRLAVKLNMHIHIDFDTSRKKVCAYHQSAEAEENGESLSSTRRAIVRAAAEIGRAMS